MVFDRKRDVWDPFGDMGWESPFTLSLLGGRSPFEKMFCNMDRVFELAEKGELPKADEGGPYIYASSTFVGPDGVPRHKEVKNFEGDFPSRLAPIDRRLQSQLDLPFAQCDSVKALPEGTRQPHYEIRTDKDELKVTVDLPGLTGKDVDLETTSNGLTLTGGAKEGRRRYSLRLDLPRPVLPGKTRASFSNGVLDITLPLVRSKSKDPNRKIKID